MAKITLIIVGGVMINYFTSSATVIRVRQDQTTIQAGIDAAVNGDTVLVGPGIYSEHILILNKNIVLMSSAGAESTIISGSNIIGTPVVSIMTTDGSTRFNGFTVQDGIGDGLADGIKLINSSARIENNIIQENGMWEPSPFGSSLGIGLWASNGGAPKIINNIFRQNIGQGRTIEFVEVSATVERNLIVENQSRVQVFVIGNISALNNTIARNVGQTFGLYIETGYGPIKNNIIANSLESGIYISVTGPTQIDYNDFFNNLRGPLIGDASLGVGNILLNPFFNAGSPYDYSLQSHSPCIDAGDPSTSAPPNGGTRVDIGAIEFELGPAFTLISPANASVEITQTPTFVWQKLPDSFTITSFDYRVLFDDTIDFSSPDSSPVLVDTVWTIASQMALGKTFDWKVRASDDSGQVVFSKTTRRFRIDTPPTVPFLLEPSNGNRAGPDSYLVLKKSVDEDSGDTVTYTLELDDQPSFISPEISVSGLMGSDSFSANRLSSILIGFQLKTLPGFNNLEDSTTYYWRAKAIDNHGVDSGWTNTTNYFVFDSVVNICGLQKGDLNDDSNLTPTDIVLLLNCVFLGSGQCDPCFADVTCNGLLTPADVVEELNAVFLNEPVCSI